ncbi:hypothetical protein OSTOST_24728 [Ostertagia ostertagi]
MKPEEARAILKPFYDTIEKNMKEGKLEENVKFVHPDGVAVQKGKAAYYGPEIGVATAKNFPKRTPTEETSTRSNEVYCGCDCCICVSFEASFDTPKGPQKVIEHQIWKKHDGSWKIYHMEYELVA